MSETQSDVASGRVQTAGANELSKSQDAVFLQLSLLLCKPDHYFSKIVLFFPIFFLP